LIKSIYQTLIRYFRKQPGSAESPEIIIVAYTGKAAHNVGGMTAHNAFSLIMAESGELSHKISPEALNTLRVKLAKLKLVIVDEISMMGSKTFEKIDARLRQVFQTNRSFGGRSVIVLGDFQQLRAVLDDYVFGTSNDPVKNPIIIGNPLWSNFRMFELTEIMRQKDVLPYAQVLGRLGRGRLTDEDERVFRSRCFVENIKDRNGHEIQLKPGEKFLPEYAKNAIRLMWKNQDVEAYNTRRVNELKTANTIRIVFHAEDKIVGATSVVEKQQVLFNLKKLTTQQTQGLPSSLILQVGVRYMVTSNIDVSDGIFNGATGVLQFIELLDGKPEAIYLAFDDPSVGRNARAARKSIML
jgi:hypothetical protein